MRVVVDTNVFVSALIRPGDALSSFVDCLDRDATVLYSVETLTELVDVLRRRKFAAYTSPEEVAEFVAWVVATGELVTVDEVVPIARDPKDDKFLALAKAGRADYVVSGDKDLRVLREVDGISILSPADFVAAVIGQVGP